MTDNLAPTIAALHENVTTGSVCVLRVETPLSGFVLESGLFGALLDAAEAGLRSPPREPTEQMLEAGYANREDGGTLTDTWMTMYDAAPINEGGQAPCESPDRCTRAQVNADEAAHAGTDGDESVTQPVPPSPDAAPDANYISKANIDKTIAKLTDWAWLAEYANAGWQLPPKGTDALAILAGRAAAQLAKQAAAITRLTAELAEARAECEEQARLLGMSGSREAKLLTEIDSLKHDNARMIARESELVSESERLRGLLTDAMRDCSPEEGQAWSLLIDEPLHDLIRSAIDAGRKQP